MYRTDFVNRLFNEGQGLTLNQIKRIDEEYLPLSIPEDLLDSFREVSESESAALEIAKEQARDVFLNAMHDCIDMVELKDFLEGLRDNANEQIVTIDDMNVYRLYMAKWIYED